MASGKPAEESGPLAELARTVIEAALEAELAEHLGYARRHSSGSGRGGNCRNGSRAKVVRTALGRVRIEAPRDRWGTFEPMTVGKWKREVVGVDRLLLPLAARDAPPQARVALLSRVYPPGASERTLRRIVATTEEKLAAWHRRRLRPVYAVLQVRRSSLRDRQGRPVGFPFVWVVGATMPDLEGAVRHELLSVHAVREDDPDRLWDGVLADLRCRGVLAVGRVVSDSAPELRAQVVRRWPGATVTTWDDRPVRPRQAGGSFRLS